jgi:hypothetical protein
MIMNKEIIVWKCPHCFEEMVSNNWIRHSLDMCGCGKSGCDMEEYYVRWIGDGPDACKAKLYHLDELLGSQECMKKNTDVYEK